jgi:hypothetical protein
VITEKPRLELFLKKSWHSSSYWLPSYFVGVMRARTIRINFIGNTALNVPNPRRDVSIRIGDAFQAGLAWLLFRFNQPNLIWPCTCESTRFLPAKQKLKEIDVDLPSRRRAAKADN